MLLTFTTPAVEAGATTGGIPGGIPGETTGGTIVIRKDYQLQIGIDGTVVGAYQTTNYPSELFGLPAAATAALTKTVEFTGQRVQ